ncbi:MAG: tetratricopeptide repeat protein [Bacteroidales bacterium]
MKNFLPVIVILLVAGSTVFGQSARKYFKTGDEFLKEKKFEDAIQQYTKAIDLNPEYDKAYVARASVYEQLGDFTAAAKDYERASVFQNNDEEIYFLAGNAYLKAGNPASALVKMNEALKIKSKYLEAYQVRSQVFLKLGRYDEALDDCKKALRFKENEVNFYNLGQVYERLELYDDAEQAYQKSIRRNNNVVDSHLALAKLVFSQGKNDLAMSAVNQVLRINPKHKDGLVLRSQIHAERMNLSQAVNDISEALNVYRGDPELHMVRGDFYHQLSRYSDAIVDYSYAIESGNTSADIYYKRARSYELNRDFKSAMADYNKLLEMSKYDGTAQQLLAKAEERMFEINREEKKPVVKLVSPVSNTDNTVHVPRGLDVIALTGLIVDDSKIKSLKINNFTVQPTEVEAGYEFLASINLRDADQLIVEVSDVYDNSERAVYEILRTETDKPRVSIIAPYASDNNVIYLDTNDPVIYLEGKIADESKIRSIYIDDIAASYAPSETNPVFSARVRIENRNKFSVKAEDIYGNISDVTFTLNREASNYSDNPMGKTWAIFIENSKYEHFASLEGPTKDVTLMKTALINYQVHNFIHKKDMTKEELERFFAIELRDLLRSNMVNSIMIWYAGHGKFVNETGYWIPVDARRDDEFTYFNINALKASMQSYPEMLTHTLVITDACESGPSFYQAMRSTNEIRSCDDWEATRFKSSQVLSSAGYELASDDSQFTRTFANTLANSPDGCIPIESIVQKVTSAVTGNNQQKPQFGKIAGLEDENGTFFFIPKDY